MAATLASLWEKKKKTQPSHAANCVDLTLTEVCAHKSQSIAKSFQPDTSDGLPDQLQIAAPVNDSKQYQGPDKKRKRTQPSAQEIQILEKCLGRSDQSSNEDITHAAKQAAVPEELVKEWFDEQRETRAKKASVLPLTAKPAASMQHDADGSPSVCAQSSQASGPDDHVLAATRLAQAGTECKRVSPDQQPGQAQQANEDHTAAAQLTQPNRTASPEVVQSTSKQHLLAQHQLELKQSMQQAQAVKPLAELPLFTDGQLNRPEVRQSKNTA